MYNNGIAKIKFKTIKDDNCLYCLEYSLGSRIYLKDKVVGHIIELEFKNDFTLKLFDTYDDSLFVEATVSFIET